MRISYECLRVVFPIYAPVGGPTKIDYKRNIKIAEKIGINLEQRLWITNPKTGLTQRTPIPARNSQITLSSANADDR